MVSPVLIWTPPEALTSHSTGERTDLRCDSDVGTRAPTRPKASVSVPEV